MSDKAMTLDEVARKTELSQEDIRRSGQMGIVPAEKGEFTEQDLQTLSGIKCLQRLGLTIEDIAELNFSPVMLAEINQYLGSTPGLTSPESCVTVLGSAQAVLRAHLDSINMQIEQLNIQKHSIEHRIDALNRLTHKLYTKIQR